MGAAGLIVLTALESYFFSANLHIDWSIENMVMQICSELVVQGTTKGVA